MTQHGIESRRFFSVFRITGLVITGIVIAAAFALLFGFVVQAAWNWLMPELFGLKSISYWQAFVLVILARILFGGFHGRHGSRSDRYHDRMRFKSFFRRDGLNPRACRKYYHDFWKEEGRKAFDQYVKRMESERGPNNTQE